MSRIVLVAPAGIATSHGVIDQARLLVLRLIELGHDPELIVVYAPRATQPPPSNEPKMQGRETAVPVSDVWALLNGTIDILWIHWANFGLSKWRYVGSPLGFARKLRTWRRAHPTTRLALSVHEGWDRPPLRDQPMRRMRGALQRPPLALALRTADSVAVNCDRWMRAIRPGVQAKVVKLATPSNFPAPSATRGAGERSDLVVMGGSAERVRLLERLRHDNSWRATVTDPAARIHSIGSDPRDEAAVQGLPVVNHGFLDADLVVALLARCRLAAIDIPPDVVDKSTLAATFRSHGLTILNFASGEVEPPNSVTPTTIDDLVAWMLDV